MKGHRVLHRAGLPPKLPPALRCFAPKLDAGQQRDLGLCHIVNLDAIAKGDASPDVLWHWVGGTLTWCCVATSLQRGLDEMKQQADLVDSVIERFKRTGRIVFSGPEYQLAKLGVQLMDELARIVDRPTAIEAANWSEEQLQLIVLAAEAERARQQAKQQEATCAPA
jgi:hypothetical protein